MLGVRRVRSKTIRGACEISVIFNPDADMPYSLQLMQAKADEVKPELPAGTVLVVERMTPSLFPIFSVNVTGGLPPADLRDLAVYQLRPLLEPRARASPTSRCWPARSARSRSSWTRTG